MAIFEVERIYQKCEAKGILATKNGTLVFLHQILVAS